MKLYATVTSERATKGQGGNRFLDIDVRVGSTQDSITIGHLSLIADGDTYHLEWIKEGAEETNRGRVFLEVGRFPSTKGKRQKGEIERDCMNCERTFKDDGSHDYCSSCR